MKAKNMMISAMRRYLCLSLILSCFSLLHAGEEPDAGATDKSGPVPAQSWEGRVVVIPIKGLILMDVFGKMQPQVETALDRASKEKARLVVIEMDSPGGYVSLCDPLSRKILQCKTRTVALVLHKAVSGGAMLASACNEIVMTKGSRIGDIQPMMQDPATRKIIELSDRTAEKSEADIRAIMASLGQSNGHPVGLLEAMVTRNIELYEVKYTSGEREFLTKKALAVVEENTKQGRDKRVIASTGIVVEEGKLLSLAPEDAVKYGLARMVVENREAFYVNEGIDLKELIHVKVEMGEFDVSKITQQFKDLGLSMPLLLILGICLVVGIAGALTEANHPGFGLPGAIGIIGFSCFFAILMMHGRGSPIGIALFVMGIILLVVEIVVIPGFGVPGALGILCLLSGLFLAFTPDIGTPYMETHLWDEAGDFVAMLGIVTVAVGIVLWALISYGSRLPLLRHFYLQKSLRSGEETRADASRLSDHERENKAKHWIDLLGQEGVSVTPLRPAGRVKLCSGELVDVVSQSVLIDSGTKVKIVDTSMNRIVVQSIDETSA